MSSDFAMNDGAVPSETAGNSSRVIDFAKARNCVVLALQMRRSRRLRTASDPSAAVTDTVEKIWNPGWIKGARPMPPFLKMVTISVD